MKADLMRRSLAVVIVGVCLLSGTVSAQTAITVDQPTGEIETTLDFGNVPVGDYVVQYLTIINNLDETIAFTPIEYVPPGSPFGTWLEDEFPLLDPNGASLDVPFGFDSYSAGEYMGSITLQYNGITPFTQVLGTIKVHLFGNSGSGFDPVVAVGDLVDFTAAAILSGTLEGAVWGKWHNSRWGRRGWLKRLSQRMAAKRLEHFLRWLVTAESLIQAGEYDYAYHLLSALLRKVDGNPSPRDWVTGQAAPEVATRIEDLMAGLAG